MPLRYSEQQEKVTSLMILSKAGFNQEPGPIYFLKAFFLQRDRQKVWESKLESKVGSAKS